MSAEEVVSQNGAAPEDFSDEQIEQWLLGPEVEADVPLPQHRFQLAMQQFVLANNTRWLSRVNFGAGKDIGDENLMATARTDAKRARVMIDRFSKEALEAWPEMKMELRHELYDGLPKEMRALIDGLKSPESQTERNS